MPDRHKIASLRISDPPTHVVALSGEHDISTLPDVEEALAGAVASGEPVIVDLHRATFVDTAILCSIIDAHHQAGGQSCFAVVMSPDGEVTRLFAMVGARSDLVTCPSLRVAIDWCASPGADTTWVGAPRGRVDGAPQQPGRVAIERHGDVRIVSLRGENDVSTVDLVRRRLADAGLGDGIIIVDLLKAYFIDSSVAGALLEAYRRDSPPRMRFVVASGTSPSALLTTLGFDGFVPIFERLDDALG